LDFLAPVTLKIPINSWHIKLWAIILRFFINRNGSEYFTFQETSNILELKDRRDSNNYWREFKQKGGDLIKYLTRKVDLAHYVNVIQDLALRNPILKITELYDLFISKYPVAKMCLETFKRYLSQTNATLLLQNIHKHLDKNNHWDSGYLLSYYIANTSEPVIMKKADEIIKVEAPIEEPKQSKLSMFTLNKCYLVMFLVGCGLSYRIISFLLGISKSYVHELVYKIKDLRHLILSSITSYSKKICVDEKYVKLNGKFVYVFSIVDAVSGVPLLIDYFQAKTAESWEVFFRVFKHHYGNPNLIISDGCLSLGKGRSIVFPDVPFQYCKFHKIKNLMKKFFKYFIDAKQRKKVTDKLKQVFSRKTVGARRKALLELDKMLFGDLKEYFKERFLDNWKNLTKSYTSNAVERFNRKIKMIVSGTYGTKSPETIQQLMYCLWFKELILNGKTHLSPMSTISNIKIAQICQEITQNCKMEQLFRHNKQQEAA